MQFLNIHSRLDPRCLDFSLVGCHVTGNDANFAERLMLMLLVRSYRVLEGLLTNELNERLNMLDAVAKALLPAKSLYFFILHERRYRGKEERGTGDGDDEQGTAETAASVSDSNC